MSHELDQLTARESARMWRADDIGDVELLRARYYTYSFARHTHEGAAVGVIEDGTETFYYRGATHTAPVGSIVLFNPAEVHTGESADERGWRFRMFYLDAALLQTAASEAAGRPQSIPFFSSPVVQDQALGALLQSLHVDLEVSTSTLARQSKFIWTFGQLAQRHADSRDALRPLGNERSAVKKVRDYLEEHYAENVSLNEISALAGLSSFHLIRVFRSAVGLPPHAYLEQIRIHRSKQLLRDGDPISHVALTTGFADQAHFSRHFKKMTGVTPGQYQAIARTYKTGVVAKADSP